MSREDVQVVVGAALEDFEDDPDPRRCVVRAYANLERLLAYQGLARRPSETPLEYLSRWVGAFRVSGSTAEALASLYERARFSLHVIDDDMRREATAAFGLLRRELEEDRS